MNFFYPLDVMVIVEAIGTIARQSKTIRQPARHFDKSLANVAHTHVGAQTLAITIIADATRHCMMHTLLRDAKTREGGVMRAWGTGASNQEWFCYMQLLQFVLDFGAMSCLFLGMSSALASLGSGGRQEGQEGPRTRARARARVQAGANSGRRRVGGC